LDAIRGGLSTMLPTFAEIVDVGAADVGAVEVYM
jgi:hypothetical protein